MEIDVGAGKYTNDSFWMTKISERLLSGEKIQHTKLNEAVAGSPLLGLEDGIMIGSFTNNHEHWRDEKTVRRMRAVGYDPEADIMSQLRFRMPQMYAAMVEAIEISRTTRETTVTLVHVTDPKPRLLYVKITPYEGGMWWLCMDLAKFGGALTKHNASIIEEFAESLKQNFG